MIKRIDFTGKFTGLDGKPITSPDGKEYAEINILLGNSLSMLKSDDPMRNMIIAKDIYTKKVIDLNESDVEFLLKQIKLLELSDLMFEELRLRIENDNK